MTKMAEESLRGVVDAISRRLREELEAQLASLNSTHQAELEGARRSAEAEAEERWNARVEAVRAEWTSRLESEVAAARAEAERRMVAESMRIREEAEQAAAEANAGLRKELEADIAQERERAVADLEAERQEAAGARGELQQHISHLERQLAEVRDEVRRLSADAEGHASAMRDAEAALDAERRGRAEDARLQTERDNAATQARVAERQVQLATVERLLTGIRSLDASRSLTQVLTALLAAAALEAPRAALFVVQGKDLKPWKSEGFGDGGVELRGASDDDGMLTRVLRSGQPVVTSTAGVTAPSFARLPEGRAAIAVPLLVGAQAVAVLYADDGGDGSHQVPASWPEAIQILSRHASVNLAHLTAARAAETMRRSLALPSAAAPGSRGAAVQPAEDGNSARRYARLLVSEIKLYNEASVRLGRQKRDLLARLKPEIDRARRLYEQRISSSLDSRGAVFQQELVQTLADGDPALLGGPA